MTENKETEMTEEVSTPEVTSSEVNASEQAVVSEEIISSEAEATAENPPAADAAQVPAPCVVREQQLPVVLKVFVFFSCIFRPPR